MPAYHYQQGDRPLDGYTIQYALGKGGFGEVYFAVSDSGREVALKAVQNFEDIELRGIGHCMNLKSPHLVMIFDIRHAADGTPWVIMEYVAGPSLRAVLDESPQGLGAEQAVFFLRELAKGLSYLHEAGVVHRDLKPHNVFFEDGIVKIGDYSLSKVITASHRSGNTMTVGSVHYMAPEISLGRYDKTVDIYALGVLLYEMLTGRPPFVGESMGEVLMKHLTSDPDVSSLPAPFAAAVSKAMQRDPADRFQTAEDMVNAVTGEDPTEQRRTTFNPATLSMIGERVRQAKIDRHTYVAASPEDHSTAPTAVQATNGRPTPSVHAPSFNASRWLQRCGLYHRPPDSVHTIPDTVSWMTRLVLAVVASLVLLLIGFGMSGDIQRPTEDLLPLAMLTVAMYGGTAAAFGRWFPDRSELTWAAVSRILWTAPGVVAILVAANGTGVGPFVGWPLLGSLIVCTALFDGRCLAAVHRQSRIVLLPTVLIGVTATLAHFMFDGHEALVPLTTALALSVAITVQLVAPVRRQAVDAPPLHPTPGRRRRSGSRLRFDKTAMVMELLVGAAVMTIIGTIASGDDDLFGFAVVAAVVGFFALRLRLARRDDVIAKNQQSEIDAPPARHIHAAVAESGQQKLDKIAVFLEGLIVAAVALLCIVFYWQDDDFFALGVAAVVIGFQAFRLRVKRRRHLLRREHRALTPSSRLRFDTGSILLELLIGACIVTIAGVAFEGHGDLFGFGAAAAVIGTVALRFRLARRHKHSLPAAAVPEVSLRDREVPQPQNEMQEIH